MPDEWRNAIILLLHKGRGSKTECNNHRGLSVDSVPGGIQPANQQLYLVMLTFDDKNAPYY